MIVDGTSVQLLVKQYAAEVPAVRQLHVLLYEAEYNTSALKFIQDNIKHIMDKKVRSLAYL